MAFRDLAERIGRGSTVLFISPKVFHKKFDWAGHLDQPLGWLPLVNQGKVELAYNPGIYRPDYWARNHPLFEGLPSGGLMDFTFYRDILSDDGYVGIDVPSVAVAGNINTSFNYASGLSLTVHALGAGEFILNTLHIRRELDRHPAAERLLRNMLNYAGRNTDAPPVELPPDFDEELAARGIRELDWADEKAGVWTI